MSFGDFSGSSSVETRMVACTASMVAQPQLVAHHSSQPLSIALKPKKMDGLGEMGILGENFEGGSSRVRPRDDESGSDNLDGGASGDDQENPPSKSYRRGKYHRHTPSQIQILEAAFKENAHPDDRTRLELGRRLNLENKQVKFWFQNRRTQMKTQYERHENSLLKQDNEKLQIENMALREALRNPVCTNCGGAATLGDVSMEEQHLRIENARLKDELNRVSTLGNKFIGRPVSSLTTSMPSPVMANSGLELAVGRNTFGGGGGGGGLSSIDDTFPMGLDFSSGVSSSSTVVPSAGPTVNMPPGADVASNNVAFLELALAAMDELVKLSQIDGPLWLANVNTSGQSLNLDEYNRTFPPCIGMKPDNFVAEATKASGTVTANGNAIVDMLMDVNRWADMFSGLVDRATTLDLISSGMGGTQNGALQLMHAELQVISPLVPSRQVKFLRYCKQHAENVWAVVDVSIHDSTRDSSNSSTYANCRRLPSGCIVHELPNGYSKVTWIEHTEYDENSVHQYFRQLVRSGMGFGAQKWIAVLQRQCECFATILSNNVPNGDPSVISANGKRSVLKLVKRMTSNFCAGVSASIHYWEVVQAGNGEDARLMLRRSLGHAGEPPGLVLSATTTIWMPVSVQHLFNFLRNEQTRCQWDVLSHEGPLQQVLNISKGEDPGNCITLLRATTASASGGNPNGTLILQESCTDTTGSLIVYTAVDVAAMQMAINGGDSSCIGLLPSGFSIVPDCFQDSSSSRGPNNSEGTSTKEGGGGSGCNNSGCLLTLGFQILINSLPAAKLSVESIETVNTLIARTLEGIKGGLQSS